MKKRNGYPSLIAAVLPQGEKIITPNAQDIAIIDKAINSIFVKEGKIVRMYYGLDDVAKTQREIGQQFSITSCRAGQILHKGMRKLNHSSRKKAFERCVDDKDNRIKILEEDSNTLIAEIQRLKNGAKNTAQSLNSLIGIQTDDDMSELEKDLQAYLMGKEIDAKKELAELFHPKNKNIDELDLSVRTSVCLKYAGIKTVGELAQKTESEMLRKKNFGRKSLNELKKVLGELGLSFKAKTN